jgi:lipopolysaccharide biosynthesis glycosyltransferase
MNKQTAVEWLENQIMTSKYFYKVLEDMQSRSTVAQPNIFRQAKEMEKEQIMLASGAGYKDGILYANGEQWIYESPEQYYNETYKQD